MRHCLPALLAVPALLAAQKPATKPAAAAPGKGVAAITAQDVERRIAIIADDSMHGRATPSPELNQVAAYVAAEFKRFGLKPAGDSGTYFQHYAVEKVQTVAESSAVWTTGGPAARWTLGTDLIFLQGTPPAAELDGPAVIVTGTPVAGGTLDSAAVDGKVVVLPLDAQGRAPAAGPLLQLKPAAVIAVGQLPDSIWSFLAGRTAGAVIRNPEDQGSGPPVLLGRDTSFRAWLAQSGLNLDSLRATGGGEPVTALAVAGRTLHLTVRQRVLQRLTAPNVAGMLPGSDPKLKSEYVFFTGHMDHIGRPADGEGCQAQGADSICNGADDDGSGTVAVLELAQAFTSSAEQPKRSLVFMTVSGEERGLWGSGHFVDHPTVPLDSVVADLNNDMVGRNGDTIMVIGREHSDLATTLDTVAARHPELHLELFGDLIPQEGLFFRSDHFNFARKGVPILFFTSGLHRDYHQVTDSPEKILNDKEARYARLVFYLGMQVANSAQKPQWNPDSYRRIVKGEN
ncbi:MAG TPA: M28 family peptidase [Gemmatimonadales bacterium]|nr:M28 family peptidase [Gemmatimonadales bacterium]